MSYQRKLSVGRTNRQSTEEHRIKELLAKHPTHTYNLFRSEIPFAESLQIPSAVFKPRRTNTQYLAFIEAVTFYHQYQREKQHDKESGEEYIETTLEDIQTANELLKEVLIRKSDPLNPACRKYLEWLKAWLKMEEKASFTNKEVRQMLRINPSNQKRYMVQLQDYDYVQKVKGEKGKTYHYEIVSIEEYERLQDDVSSILDEILEKLAKKFKPVQRGSRSK